MNTELTITIEPDPEIMRRMKLFARNGQWLSEHGGPYYERYRGQFIAVAAAKFSASLDPQEAERLALEKYPEDVPYLRYIFKEQHERIYAC